MPRPIITLSSDFGTSDHYAGVMKGVILGICPMAEIVDITHEITPFEVTEGAFTIAQMYPYFPKRTIHVVVVDPGVGTSRRPILVEAAGQYFIGPDNGVLAMVYEREKSKVRELTNEKYFRQPVSRTFHGRDIFSPCGAHLAMGVKPAMLGKLIHDHLRPLFMKPIRSGKRTWSGAILKIDHFGNLITNLHIDEFPDLKLRPVEVQAGLCTIRRIALTYATTEPEEVFAIIGSSGYLEISMNQSSAAKQLGCGIGAPVDLTFF
jgi:S-adenosyl-L-methionine hydrolase (adenosine-forming)